MTKKKSQLSVEELEKLAKIAKAMGHPTRLTILQFLASLDSCYFGDIGNELPIAKSTLSQHLAELKDAGLIQGSIEPPKVKYCINQENWEKAQKLFQQFFNKGIIKIDNKENISCCS